MGFTPQHLLLSIDGKSYDSTQHAILQARTDTLMFKYFADGIYINGVRRCINEEIMQAIYKSMPKPPTRPIAETLQIVRNLTTT